MRATLHDVARLAGVSFKTVSNVVNDYQHVSERTRARVQAAITELGYQPNPAARSLRRGRTGMIGLAVPEIDHPYFAALAGGVVEEAAKRGYVVIIEQTNRVRERELEALFGPTRRMTDGLLFSGNALNSSDLGLARSDRPIVLLGEPAFSPSLDHVTQRNASAAKAATEFLIARGHRRIGVIGVHPTERIGTAGERQEGYLNAIREAGIAFDPRLLAVAEPWRRPDGAAAMNELFSRDIDLTAVLAFNDTLALGAMHAIQSHGLRVPEDISVVGWDDIEDARYSNPTLTTVEAGRREIPRLAVDALLARIERPEDPPRFVIADFRLIERGSTGPSPRR